jgi:hypothetical protein
VVVAVLSAGAFACGGGVAPSGAAPATDQDAGTDAGPVTTPVEAGAPMEAAPPADHGAPSSTYPAFPVNFGQLANGGTNMTAPVIVAITWNSDPSQAYYDSFADTLGGTSYWQQTSSEWGIGPATSGTVNHVHLAGTVPATLADADVQTMVTTNAGAVGGWPAPTANTIYAFFLAPGTSLNIGGGGGGGGGGSSDACTNGVGGYHDQVTVGSITTSYAVVDSCNLMITPSVADQTTASMSHEINEAASDPQPQSNTGGVAGFDNNSFAYDYFMLPLVQSFSAENGDACEIFLQSFYEDKETTPAPFDYWVQRIWSNKSAAAGHDPCVPAAAAPYFNVTPLALQTVNVYIPAQLTGTSSAQQQPTKGFKVLAGTSETFAVGFYSDAATGPWKISADMNNPLTGGQGMGTFNTSLATVSLDKTSGQNGEKAYVTVKVASSGSTFKGEVVTITSSLNGVDHYMPIWIAGQ